MSAWSELSGNQQVAQLFQLDQKRRRSVAHMVTKEPEPGYGRNIRQDHVAPSPSPAVSTPAPRRRTWCRRSRRATTTLAPAVTDDSAINVCVGRPGDQVGAPHVSEIRHIRSRQFGHVGLVARHLRQGPPGRVGVPVVGATSSAADQLHEPGRGMALTSPESAKKPAVRAYVLIIVRGRRSRGLGLLRPAPPLPRAC